MRSLPCLLLVVGLAAGCNGAAEALCDAGLADAGCLTPAPDLLEPDLAGGRDLQESSPDLPADNGCFAGQVGPTPADASDVEYSYVAFDHPGCLSKPFCQASCASAEVSPLLACAQAEAGFFWSLGSVYVRVHGRQSGACVLDIGLEVEGGVSFQRCTTPLPVRAWRGLSAIDQSGQLGSFTDGLDCTQVSTCSTVPGGPDPCDGSPTGAPICPTFPGAC